MWRGVSIGLDDECSQPLCPGLFVVVVVHIGTRECTLHNSPHWRMLDGFGYMCVGSILRYYPWIRQEKVTYTCMMAGHERPTWSSALQCRKLVLRDVDLPMSSLPSPLFHQTYANNIKDLMFTEGTKHCWIILLLFGLLANVKV